MTEKSNKPLIIVESPAKTRTLRNFLGSGYEFSASYGHILDLPARKFGMDIDNGFKPTYKIITKKQDIVRKLKQTVKDFHEVYIATDPDREGEAIAWHLVQTLKIENAKRIELHEITKDAITRALQQPREIDMNRVNAQQTRRILDRLVGYKLSPLLWEKIKRRLSAGRVQSVALRLICEREREIEAFIPQEYWTITAQLTPKTQLLPFNAELYTISNKKIWTGGEPDTKTIRITNQQEAQKIIRQLKPLNYVVAKIQQKERKRKPAPPFITSTLQQEAFKRLGFTIRRTMMVAQQLYEGLDIGPEGTVGLITYMRTDSTHIAEVAQREVRKYIQEKYGDKFLPEHPPKYKAAVAAQEAHEAIRPTSTFREPGKIKQYLNPDQFKLYELIWQRFVASQMNPAIFDVTIVDIKANGFTFRTSGATMKFLGFTIVYPTTIEETTLPKLKEDQPLELLELIPKQHFTQPPPRYTEATLVKTLEELGIGRPSTYAPIIQTIQDRVYVFLEDRKFKPTKLGMIVSDFLIEGFPNLINVKFTAQMEGKLDEIEEGKNNEKQVLTEFYFPFEKTLQKVQKEAEGITITPETTSEICEKCGQPMVIREGRYGKFLGCSGFPKCRNARSISAKTGIKCSLPGCNGEIIEKRTKRRRLFYGCTNYPECTFASWTKPIDRKCPQCQWLLTVQKNKEGTQNIQCTNRQCDYKEYVTEEPLPEQPILAAKNPAKM